MSARHQETITQLKGKLTMHREQQARIDQTITALNEHQSSTDRTLYEMKAKHEQDMVDVKEMLQHLLVRYKKIVPKAANDVKLISAGKILENNKTVGQCRVPFAELPGGVITMHVVVQPSLAKTKTGMKKFSLDLLEWRRLAACDINLSHGIE
ncbi:hypothetical protein HHK36_015889 [Tetracentron sinense]|uniref:UBL3-like ubiquitin domain-containing protein n=1 Tax=Tetracentron sinense TaxID=13715 RepID=A0A834Z6Z4_TETSI|nr:hypothetical protein HHK36_015889 [Tetracentron sinense]